MPLITADIREWASSYQGPKFHALLSDPPYGLNFMHAHWDDAVAFDKATWQGIAAHLHDGAFGMAFSSARTYHRLACAIEDAGLRLHHSLFGWYNASGFPKATRVKDERFAGHYYGGQVLKNALEPILLFQKTSKQPQTDILRTGAGTLNINQGRIPDNSSGSLNAAYNRLKGQKARRNSVFQKDKRPRDTAQAHPNGRWPMNVFFVCEVGCQNNQHTVGCPVIELEQQGAQTADCHFQANWQAERIEAQFTSAPLLRYEKKASSFERDLWLDELPTQLLHRVNAGELANEPRWQPRPAKNTHKTVKPISLAVWLATLLCPPASIVPTPRLLNPFSGSGSEIIGAIIAGFGAWEGVEQAEEHAIIAKLRIKKWKEFVELHGREAVRQAFRNRQLKQLISQPPTTQLKLFS